MSRGVRIIGVPMDLGSKPLGVEMGPTAIRYAGLSQALKKNGFIVEDYGDVAIDKEQSENNCIKEIRRVSEEVAEIVAGTIEEGKIPIVLGGDHSVSIGSIAGSAKNVENLGLLWLDGHPDANTPETSPTGNIHGMTVAISLGYGYPELVNCAGFKPKIIPENICIVGAKDIDDGEREFLEKTGVVYYSLYDIDNLGITKVIEEGMSIASENCDGIHLSFDVDVLDPIIAPGTGIISRGGLSYREISYIMQHIGKRNMIRSIDIIEINPVLDVRNKTSELAVELILSALGGSYGEYERYYLSK